MTAESQLLPISALQHLLFCERQCALIHLERLWAENRLTIEGQQLHRKAHDDKARGVAPRPGVRLSRGLQLVSYRLGLVGVADVVEFHERTATCDGAATGGKTAPLAVPIEYKRGRPKAHDADKVQLCAQALCLEEMFDAPGSIPAGAIFYGRTRRRQQVEFDVGLREKTKRTAERLHDMIASAVTPIARREPKCDKCSLIHLCLPDAMKPRRTAERYLEQMTAAALASA